MEPFMKEIQTLEHVAQKVVERRSTQIFKTQVGMVLGNLLLVMLL